MESTSHPLNKPCKTLLVGLVNLRKDFLVGERDDLFEGGDLGQILSMSGWLGLTRRVLHASNHIHQCGVILKHDLVREGKEGEEEEEEEEEEENIILRGSRIYAWISKLKIQGKSYFKEIQFERYFRSMRILVLKKNEYTKKQNKPINKIKNNKQ